MKDRTLAIILTIISVLFCGLPGLCIVLSGGVTGYFLPVAPASSGQPDQFAQNVPIVAICIGLLMVLISVGVAYFTLRKPKEVAEAAKPDEPIPPAL